MKIAAGICEYGDSYGLYRCLASLALDKYNGFDMAIIIHGKFGHFDYKLEDAYEQTQQVVSRFPKNRVHLVNANEKTEGTELTELQARNMYLQEAAKLDIDWLLVIDTDEYVARKVSDFALLRDQLDYIQSLELKNQIYDIPFEGVIAAYRGPRPRWFYLRPGPIHYYKKHYWWVLEAQKDKEGFCTVLKGLGDGERIITGIALLHDPTIRQPEYYTAALDYKDWQVVAEGLGQE